LTGPVFGQLSAHEYSEIRVWFQLRKYAKPKLLPVGEKAYILIMIKDEFQDQLSHFNVGQFRKSMGSDLEVAQSKQLGQRRSQPAMRKQDVPVTVLYQKSVPRSPSKYFQLLQNSIQFGENINAKLTFCYAVPLTVKDLCNLFFNQQQRVEMLLNDF
ncbi:hypothetical protein STEG23_004391, partial [Scotinomys teguina]